MNPFKELTDAEIETVRGLVGGLEIAYPGHAHSHLGFSGYAASFEDMHVIASLYGHVRVYDAQGQEKAYSDTTGVLAYLCKIMTPVMIQHQTDAKKAMDDFVAFQFPYVPPPWEPNF
jgi:hypothetical protein